MDVGGMQDAWCKDYDAKSISGSFYGEFGLVVMSFTFF